MMDQMTREELKEVLVQTVEHSFVIRLEALMHQYGLEASLLTPPVPVPALLAELVVERKITQRYFRVGTDPVRIYYFPKNVRSADLTQAEMGERIKFRPADFAQLDLDDQFAWDRALGVLDYEAP